MQEELLIAVTESVNSFTDFAFVGLISHVHDQGDQYVLDNEM